MIIHKLNCLCQVSLKFSIFLPENPEITNNKPECGIFPDENTTKVLHKSNKTFIARTLIKFVPSFELFRKNVPHHIKHQYSKEIAKKSEVVSFYAGYNGVTIYGFTITLTYHEYSINA